MNVARLTAVLGLLLTMGWPAPAGAQSGGPVADERTLDSGPAYFNGNLLANDPPGSGIVYDVKDSQGNSLPWYILFGNVIFDSGVSTGGRLMVWQANGNYRYFPPSPFPVQYVEKTYSYLTALGSAPIKFWMPSFRVDRHPVLATLEVDEDLIGMAENAAPIYWNNPPGARTVQMGVGDFMDRSFPAVRVSGVSNQEVRHGNAPTTIYDKSQIEFLNTDFESEEGMVITDSFDVASGFFGEGTVQGTALIAPKAGLYRFEASLGMGIADYDSEIEDPFFGVGIQVLYLVKFGEDYLYGAWAGDSRRRYPMDAGETGSNTAHLAVSGTARLAAGDALMLQAMHWRDALNGPNLINELMYIDESMPRFPYFEMQWISD